jgi:hypothetical protein
LLFCWIVGQKYLFYTVFASDIRRKLQLDYKTTKTTPFGWVFDVTPSAIAV